MSDNNTLLGHLVPKLPVSTENAAVEALAFILNDSEAAMAAFNALIGEGVGVPIAPIARVASQATAGFRSEVGFAPIQTAPENPKSKRNRCFC